MIRAIAVAGSLVLALHAVADTRHSSTVVAFRKAEPCPATGLPQKKCPGYVVDHIVPLCLGGPDSVTNMQFQTLADSYRKDRLERAQCRAEKQKK